MKKTAFKNVAVLTIIALVAVFLLALVYEVTKAPIAEAAARKQKEAYEAMYDADCAFAALDAEGEGISSPMTVTKDGQLLGFALTASGMGYGGEIRLALRIDLTDGKAVINGMRVLYADDETQGFGAKCKEESYWGAYTDSGKTEADAISGATLTTGGIREAVGYALAFAEAQVKGGAA